MTSSHSSIAVLDGIEDFSSRYDLFFCDIWGVLHNGIKSFAPAVEALARFRARGGMVVLVSNAPRPWQFVVPMLEELGVSADAYDAIVTSGDVSREAVVNHAGQRVYHIGPERDLTIFDGTGAVFASIEEAEYVACTGLFDDETEAVEDYHEALNIMRRRKLWMLCANPDLVVERGNQLILCGGAIAAAYEQMGGEVYWAGKPHRPVYVKALERANALAGREIATDRILAIGDAIRTDIAGARYFGVDSLMVARGIHARVLGIEGGGKLSADHAREWLSAQDAQPQAIIDSLSW